MYSEAIKKYGSFRKAAKELGLTKSKLMVLYKKELGLCTGTTGCKNPCKPERTRCEEHLNYALKTQDLNNKKTYMQTWNTQHADYKRDYAEQYQKANLERFRISNRKFQKTEKGRVAGNARRALRRASQKQATPPWVDKEALKAIYANCPKGYHVDHIIPLQNSRVCGLHVPCNLQYLEAVLNDEKGNSFDGTYENDSCLK